MAGMTFTDESRRTLHAGGDEAAALHHEYIGTEHVLLALLNDPDSAAMVVLMTLGANVAEIRTEVRAVVKAGHAADPPGSPRPYTSRAKKALELAMLSARDDNHASVGTQHLLLGLLRENRGVAAQVLAHCGVTIGPVTAALDAVKHLG
jgi:ATP-dependent Clp protease ATP-binding subunit ClpC